MLPSRPLAGCHRSNHSSIILERARPNVTLLLRYSSYTAHELAIDKQHPHRGPCHSRQFQSRNCSASSSSVHASASDDGLPLPASLNQQAQFEQDLLRRVLAFMGPAMVIPLADPLMSIVDTVCIGKFTGTAELAALGPSNIVFAFAQYVFQSLQLATLSLVASRFRQQQQQQAELILSTALFLAITCGLLVSGVLQNVCILPTNVTSPWLFRTINTFSTALIQATGVKDLALIPLSCEYLQIRALAQPAVLITMVCQSTLLAQQQSFPAMIGTAASTLVSLLGNVVFVAWLGYGLAGAAWTTVATQYVAAALFYATCNRCQVKPYLRIPSRSDLFTLLATMAPLSVTSLCKNLCYIFIQTTAAGLATAKLAAHQAAFSVWNLIAFTLSPQEQSAITFVPAAKSKSETQVTAALVIKLAIAGGVIAGSFLLCALSLFPCWFSNDLTVCSFMRTVALQAGLSMLLVGVDTTCTGVNIAMSDLNYVARSYVVTLLSMYACMAACRHYGWGLPGVWWGIVGFFGVRALQSSSRVWLKVFQT